MDTNPSLTQDQVVLTEANATVKKSNGLLMTIGAVLLLLSLITNAYFFSQMQGSKQVGQPKGQQIPVAQIEVQPTVITTTTPTNTVPSSIKSKQVIDNLSKIDFSIPEGWSVQVKSFDNFENTLDFKSKYFASCTHGCQGVRFTKKEMHFDLIFDKVMDSMGGSCSNNVTVAKLSNGWYRVKDSKNYTYAKKGITFDQTLSEVFQVVPKTETSDWSYEDGQQYKVCLSYAGEFLDVMPDNFDPKLNDYGLLLEYPTISSSTPEIVLKEIDQIISSI